MAIEDEIINIADLDVGTELLKTDKLLIETNNGTKLLDFKDFVIGPDNISSVRDDQIEYETTGEAATRNSSTSFSIVTGFNILTTDTTPGLKTSYKDLSGSIELGKFNYNAIKHLATLSGGWASLDNRFADLNSRVAAQEETTGTTSLSAVNFKVHLTTPLRASKGSATKNHVIFDYIDLNPTDTHTEGTATFAEAPFKFKYPAATKWSRSWIQFTGQFFFVFPNSSSMNGFANDFTLELWVNGTRVYSGNTMQTGVGGNPKTISINHMELIEPGDEIILKGSTTGETNNTFGKGSFFTGFRIAGA